MYVNDLPRHTTTSSVALFAGDTKCYHAIKGAQDVQNLQRDMDGINQWCRLWRMTLNESKCGVLTVTRNVNSVQSSYHMTNEDNSNTLPLKKLAVQKDLGILITADLKWDQQVNVACWKANRMLGFVKRSSIDISNPRIRASLYKTLVRSYFAYCSQVWSPQSFSLIEISYKDRLLLIGLLPLSYWQEYLHLVYFVKALKSKDPKIDVKFSSRITRLSSTNNILINVQKVNSLTFVNSFLNRTPKIYNCLPPHIREADVTIGQFQSYLRSYYHSITEKVYVNNVLQTFKTVCVKCHSCRPLSSLMYKLCCN